MIQSQSWNKCNSTFVLYLSSKLNCLSTEHVLALKIGISHLKLNNTSHVTRNNLFSYFKWKKIVCNWQIDSLYGQVLLFQSILSHHNIIFWSTSETSKAIFFCMFTLHCECYFSMSLKAKQDCDCQRDWIIVLFLPSPSRECGSFKEIQAQTKYQQYDKLTEQWCHLK